MVIKKIFIKNVYAWVLSSTDLLSLPRFEIPKAAPICNLSCPDLQYL